MTKCNVCGRPIEDRGYKHAQCRRCGQISHLCCDPELECAAPIASAASNCRPTAPEKEDAPQPALPSPRV